MFTEEGFSIDSGFRIFCVFTGDGFSLNSGFTEILCSPENPLLALYPEGSKGVRIAQGLSVKKGLPRF